MQVDIAKHNLIFFKGTVECAIFEVGKFGMRTNGDYALHSQVYQPLSFSQLVLFYCNFKKSHCGLDKLTNRHLEIRESSQTCIIEIETK